MLEYIKNNPYRVLGVYANEPEKKWVENSLELFVSLKHDNSLSFPTDWTEVLGPLHRNLKNVKDAAFILEDKDIRELESLFWVHSKGSDSFVGNLGHDIDLEMGVKPYEKAINAALIAIGKGENIKALHRYKVAFQCKRPTSKVLVLFFDRIIKVYLRKNPTGNAFGFLYSIFGEDCRIEFQEAMQSFVPAETRKSSIQTDSNDCVEKESLKRPTSKTKPRRKSSFKHRLNWNKIYTIAIQPWFQYNGWTFWSIALLITVIYLFLQL